MNPLTSPLWLPPNGSLHGAAVDRLLHLNLSTLAALLLLAHLLLLYAVLRRRRPSPATLQAPGSSAESPHRLHPPSLEPEPFGPAPLEEAPFEPVPRAPAPRLLPSTRLAETLPILLCCLLFAVMTITSERLWATLRYEGPSPAAMQVEVVGAQFQWYFRYPGVDAHFGQVRPRLVDAAAGNPLGLDPADSAAADDIVSSVLLLPAGREVDLRLRAHDVIHGFFIPGMRLKQNAVPGLVLHVHFTPLTPGVYPILCTQVCGSGHARMQATLRVIPPGEFAAWLTSRTAARQRQLLTRSPLEPNR